jgi:ATP-dependent exoDNAse (exonuclease V) beta subunit
MVIADRDGVAGLRVSRVGGSPVKTATFRTLEARQRADEAAEERRVLYVAATRAQRHLVVVGRSGAGGIVGDAAFQVLDDAYGDPGRALREFDNGGRASRRVVEVLAPDRDAGRLRVEVPATLPADAPRPAGAPAADPVTGRRLSFSALATFATCSRRFHLERELGLRGRPEAVVAGGGSSETAWDGAALGNLVHAVLERHDWTGRPPEPGWAATAAEAAGLPPSAVDAERAERMVADLMASRLAARIAAGDDRWAERRFATTVDGAVLSGSIDLLVDETAGGALLVDWKTHRLAGRPASDVAAEYAAQQALYGLAALRAGHERATLQWAVLEDLPGSVERVVTAADVPGLEAEVRAALAGLRDGERPAATTTPQPLCSGCPGLDALCPVAEAFAR